MARTNIRSQSNDPERSDSVQKIYELTNQRCQEIKKLIMEKAQLSS